MVIAGALGLGIGWGGVAEASPAVWHRDRGPQTELERTESERLLVLVSKDRPLSPPDYAPPDLLPWRDTAYELRAEVADQLDLLFTAAESEGLDLRVISGYRSYETQASTYQGWVRQYGQASADATSARAGHSEHQTGLAVDLDSTRGECYLDACFGTSPEGEWVARNAHLFGFVLSYPQGHRERTGYVYEPWHIRYVGPHVATDMHDLGIVLLEDYLSPRHLSARLGLFLGRRP